MPAPELQVLLIGETARPEFHAALAALDDVAHVSHAAGIDEAIRILEDGSLAPHVIALVQAYPDQFPLAAIDRLRNLAPLARMVALLGSWCEGEPRSGHPLPGVTRLYWHHAAGRIRREFPRWLEPEGAAWLLPATATDEDRLLALSQAPLPQGKGLVALWTRHAEMQEMLADVCGAAGYATVWLHPRQLARIKGAVAAIYDGATLDAVGMTELTVLSDMVAPAPVLALLDAPRIQEARLAGTVGAAVMAKPFRIDELLSFFTEENSHALAQRFLQPA